ncbi:MAG: ABC transporter ATP-binding protein [Caldilineaceae bacterium]
MPSNFYFMWRLFIYRPWPQIISGCCWILFHSWALWPGLLAKAFFDLLAGSAPFGINLPTLVVLVMVLALVRVGAVYLDIFVGNTTGMRVRGLVQRNLLMRVLERPGAKALPGSVGEALSTFRDDVKAMWGAGWAFDVIAYTIFALGGLAILLWVDGRVTLLVFIPIVTVIGVAHVMGTRLQRVREQSRAATAQVTGALGEIFGAVQAIQVAGAEERVVAQVRRLGVERQAAMLRDQLLGLVLNAVFANTASLGAGLTMLAAASALRRGDFTVGDFALFATYLLQVTDMTGFLGWMVATYQQMSVAFRRGVALLQGAPPTALVAHHPVPVKEPLPPLPILVKKPTDQLTTLTVDGLTFRYPDGSGIADISFCLPRGTLTVITGRIGAGKSTLLRTLLGLLPAQGGTIHWNGEQVDQPAAFLIPPRVTYLPQVPTLLSGTIRENILLGLPSDPEQLTHAIHTAALDQDLAAFPAGLDTVIGARGVRLSGGQIQRTAAARMLVRALHGPVELLVIDDLSSALDVETEQQLWQRLFQLTIDDGYWTLARDEHAGGQLSIDHCPSSTTYLVVSHRPAVLARADQILVLAEGQLTAVGRLEALLQSCEEMRLLYSQSHLPFLHDSFSPYEER